MYASCATCQQPLTHGYYISAKGFERMEKGGRFKLTEVIGCPTCGKIAIKWDDELYFYEENQK